MLIQGAEERTTDLPITGQTAQSGHNCSKLTRVIVRSLWMRAITLNECSFVQTLTEDMWRYTNAYNINWSFYSSCVLLTKHFYFKTALTPRHPLNLSPVILNADAVHEHDAPPHITPASLHKDTFGCFHTWTQVYVSDTWPRFDLIGFALTTSKQTKLVTRWPTHQMQQ